MGAWVGGALSEETESGSVSLVCRLLTPDPDTTILFMDDLGATVTSHALILAPSLIGGVCGHTCAPVPWVRVCVLFLVYRCSSSSVVILHH